MPMKSPRKPALAISNLTIMTETGDSLVKINEDMPLDLTSVEVNGFKKVINDPYGMADVKISKCDIHGNGIVYDRGLKKPSTAPPKRISSEYFDLKATREGRRPQQKPIYYNGSLIQAHVPDAHPSLVAFLVHVILRNRSCATAT